jgi:hypothetical protein
MRAGRHMRRDLRDNRALHRADVGENCARRKMRRDHACDLAASADRHAENDEIGARHGLREIGGRFIGYAELTHARAHLFRGVARGDPRRSAIGARAARDRRADEAEADQRDLLEDRRARVSHARPAAPRAMRR